MYRCLRLSAVPCIQITKLYGGRLLLVVKIRLLASWRTDRLQVLAYRRL